MTADIEMLPLPEADDSVENHTQWPIVTVSDVWLQKSVQDYARACVVHAIAAKDAENEKRTEQAEDCLGDIIHQASNTSNGVRTVLRQHTKGFSRTILRNVRTKENPVWHTLEHQEYRLKIDSGESDE